MISLKYFRSLLPAISVTRLPCWKNSSPDSHGVGCCSSRLFFTLAAVISHLPLTDLKVSSCLIQGWPSDSASGHRSVLKQYSACAVRAIVPFLPLFGLEPVWYSKRLTPRARSDLYIEWYFVRSLDWLGSRAAIQPFSSPRSRAADWASSVALAASYGVSGSALAFGLSVASARSASASRAATT
nr:hypothetical protein GCM10020092_105920 [Actinoplanes digitatis]